MFCPIDATVGHLKQLISKQTGVPASFQKIACKGMLIRDNSRDSEQLEDAGLRFDSRPQLMLLLNRVHHQCEENSQTLTRAATLVDVLATDTHALRSAVARRQVSRAKTHVSLLQLNDRHQSLCALVGEAEIPDIEDVIVRDIRQKQVKAKHMIQTKLTSVQRELAQLNKSNIM